MFLHYYCFDTIRFKRTNSVHFDNVLLSTDYKSAQAFVVANLNVTSEPSGYYDSKEKIREFSLSIFECFNNQFANCFTGYTIHYSQ